MCGNTSKLQVQFCKLLLPNLVMGLLKYTVGSLVLMGGDDEMMYITDSLAVMEVRESTH